MLEVSKLLATALLDERLEVAAQVLNTHAGSTNLFDTHLTLMSSVPPPKLIDPLVRDHVWCASATRDAPNDHVPSRCNLDEAIIEPENLFLKARATGLEHPSRFVARMF